MRVLLVEDEAPSAAMAATELRDTMPCDIVTTPDPIEAMVRLTREGFDLAVVDMLYTANSVDFETRRQRGEVHLTDRQLHISGLAVLQAARKAGTKSIICTNAESNRRLHMLLAYEQLGCRLLCPKDAIGKLAAAAIAAVNDRTSIDPILRMHLPHHSAPSLRETFFYSSTRVSVWRAMALGLHDHSRIARAIGVAPGTVRRGVEEMRARLVNFDAGCSTEGPPTTELVRYASQNWQFFLDDTVREIYP